LGSICKSGECISTKNAIMDITKTYKSINDHFPMMSNNCCVNQIRKEEKQQERKHVHYSVPQLLSAQSNLFVHHVVTVTADDLCLTIKPPRFREEIQLGFAVQTQVISNNLMYGHAPLNEPMSVADYSKKNKTK